MARGWHDRYGRLELWDDSRCIAVVQQVLGKWTVTIDARMPWQVVKGPAASKEQGRRHIERWLRARKLLVSTGEPPSDAAYVPSMAHLILPDRRTAEERAEAQRREYRRRKGGNRNWWKNDQKGRPGT